MEFLQVQLHQTSKFNTLFQSDQPLLHALHEKVCQLLKELMSDFVKLDVIRNCDFLTLNVCSKLVQVSTVDVYVGINATKMLKIVCRDKDAVLKFKTTCMNFLEELVDQIRSRFGSSLFKQLEFIQPANMLKMISPTLAAVMQTYPKLIEGCDVSLVDLEWRQLGLKG